MTLFLSSYEYVEFEMAREIRNFRKEKINNRNTLVIEIDKPIIGQKYGFFDKDIYTLYLINRVDENSFDRLDSFPIDVYVLISKNPEVIIPKNLSEMQNIAWACLYNSKKDAIKHKIK